MPLHPVLWFAVIRSFLGDFPTPPHPSFHKSDSTQYDAFRFEVHLKYADRPFHALLVLLYIFQQGYSKVLRFRSSIPVSFHEWFPIQQLPSACYQGPLCILCHLIFVFLLSVFLTLVCIQLMEDFLARWCQNRMTAHHHM